MLPGRRPQPFQLRSCPRKLEHRGNKKVTHLLDKRALFVLRSSYEDERKL
jgi:hypothetical protein